MHLPKQSPPVERPVEISHASGKEHPGPSYWYRDGDCLRSVVNPEQCVPVAQEK